MLKPLRGDGRTHFLRSLLGRLSFALSSAIFIVGALVFYHFLRGVNPEQLLHVLKSTQLRTLLGAGALVGIGYLTLTFYDLFALRTIGRTDVPYRIAALSGFTSYAVGHNVGASVFSGGAVRYHIYSRWGLSVVEVTKISFVAGLTFWLGNATVLGLGILYDPAAGHAIDHLPLWLNRALAGVVLALLGSYIAWVWSKPRVIGREDWQLRLPGGPFTLVQIVIGFADLTSCAAAVYLLLPNHPEVGFVTVAVVFVAATMLGFASHAPGGLGVFDATMMAGLIQFHKVDLLAGVLLFRLLYYITPFVLSLFILGLRGVVFSHTGRRIAAATPGSGSVDEHAR